MKVHLKDFLLIHLNSIKEKLTRRDDALETMVLALTEEIVELKGELTIYKVSLSNGKFNSGPNQ
ncbi:hypothetical protein PVK06_027415 [Gossypium arboreum]|uniref:Uncharacterized protein n=1 Tax=Gossypium arboreum TaxID=29729 RepID=A0ABR0P3P8_GOSAR|nr:hypothetical protein PVK06_027415 [Gossypium arboreum]